MLSSVYTLTINIYYHQFTRPNNKLPSTLASMSFADGFATLLMIG